MDTETSNSTDVSRTLREGIEGPPAWRKYAKWGVLALVVIVVGYFIFGRGDGKAPTYVTQDVTRGDLTVTVTATGNLEPRNQVEIGSELSGLVSKVMADVNDEVKEGQVLAILDTNRLNAQVLQQESSLASAQARVLQADATTKESKANLARLQKVRELSGNKLPSQQDLDVAEAAVARAEGEAAAARAAVAQSRASLEAVRTDLRKTEIRSPISGVILVRSIEPGQTVAATMTAPVLFIMAEDLKKMELHVSVDEADVGSVALNQEASFTVDAFPNRRFNARITQVHFASSNTKSSSSSSSSAASATSTGVVTYETVLEVDNPELLLRPGMTATAEIVTTNIQNALLVPNAALRFAPPAAEGANGPNGGAGARPGGPLSAIMPMPRIRMGGGRNQQQGAGRRMGKAYVLEDGKPALVMFRAGATDGRMTEVLPFDRPPNAGGNRQGGAPGAGGGNGNRMGPPGISPEELQKAFERKLEEGTKVIVDAGAATP